MMKIWKRVLICCIIAGISWTVGLLKDRNTLKEGLIRFHVVANSDSKEDQSIKYKVRDAVLCSIQSDLAEIRDVEKAKAYLQENLPKIRILVDQTLQELDFKGGSKVTLSKESFCLRRYDTFSLPAGVYESLRIVIGEGAGKNWWCVSFPTLCLPETGSGFKDTAVSAGFSQPLTDTLVGNGEYKIRFYVLNQLGKLENIFFGE